MARKLSSSSITSLNLEYCNLGARGVAALAAILPDFKTLQQLSLKQNGADSFFDYQEDKWIKTPEAATALAEAFSKMPQLNSVDLSGSINEDNARRELSQAGPHITFNYKLDENDYDGDDADDYADDDADAYADNDADDYDDNDADDYDDDGGSLF